MSKSTLDSSTKNIAVILAGGMGKRFGETVPKQLSKVAGKTVIEHTLKVFNDTQLVDEIIIVIKSGYEHKVLELVNINGFSKVSRVLLGGEERRDSTLAAINALAPEPGSDKFNVLFHDAVRPFVGEKIVQRCLDALLHYNAVDVAINTADTIIAVEDDLIVDMPKRDKLRRGQTPQGFKLGTIKHAYELAEQDSEFVATDDCGVVHRYLPDEPIVVVSGEENNIKITHEQDIFLADKLFQIRTQETNYQHSENYYNSCFGGKTLVVFGGSYGIGMDIVKLANKYGANVFSFSRTQTNTSIESGSDVKKALDSVYSETGQIDFVVNTAAILIRKSFSHMTHNEIMKTLNVNYLGVINIAKLSLSYLKISHGHLLLFTSSSYTRGRANYSLYSSSKAAVVNLTQALADEWDAFRVKINCINPARTKTPMRVANFGQEDDSTLLDPVTVAKEAITTLVSSYTGQVINVNF